MSSRASRPILWTLALIIVLALAFAAYEVLGPGPLAFASGKRVQLSAYREDPTGVPAGLKTSSLVERGEYLTRAADCAACHTADGGAPFAGGRGFVLPFGTLYSTNITPDRETGIGTYTDQNFLDVMHKGIGPGNLRLYPAMPYTSYTYLSDADVLAIKAYLFSLKPMHAPVPQSALSFPFNQRALMGLWSAFFNPNQRYQPNTERDAQWNRGAYLAEALAHCGECHTPRNLLFALNNRQKFAGEVQAGWRAYDITPDRDGGIGSWSEADLAHYLSSGHADGRGTAAGPMGEAVEMSLRHLEPDDIAALVAYVRSVASVASNLPRRKLNSAPASPAEGVTASAGAAGKAVYEGACAGCHGWTGESPVLPLATLTGTRTVNDPSAVNVAQVILHGGPRHVASDPNDMPAFGSTYSDQEIASVANYVTARFGSQGSTLTAANVARLRHEE